jgi:hypothetical protein
MGSGLTAGDAYPIKATTPTSGTATIEDTSSLHTGTTTSLRVGGISVTTLAANAVDIIFSTGEDGDTTIGYVMSATISGFFFASTTDTRVRQEYYYEAANALTMDGALSAYAATTAKNTGSSTTNQSGVTLSMDVKTAATATGDSMQFILAYGATFGTTTFTFASGADSFGTINSLSSTTRFYQFPTVWGLSTAHAAGAFTTPVAIQVSAVNSRISDFTATTAGKDGYAMNSAQGTAATAACTHSATIDWVAMGLADSTKPFTTCTVSLTATNTQSAATKAFT